jgi:hypothetical protein
MYFENDQRHRHFLAQILVPAIISPITHHPIPIRCVTMPGPTRKGVALSPRQLEIILARFEEGTMEHSAVTNEIGCSVSCIRQKSVLYNSFATVVAPRIEVLGRPRLVLIEVQEVRLIRSQTSFCSLCERLM